MQQLMHVGHITHNVQEQHAAQPVVNVGHECGLGCWVTHMHPHDACQHAQTCAAMQLLHLPGYTRSAAKSCMHGCKILYLGVVQSRSEILHVYAARTAVNGKWAV